ncbi:MAG: polysaccharide pyruvyl transferase family protein [Polyangiales bacterium]
MLKHRIRRLMTSDAPPPVPSPHHAALPYSHVALVHYRPPDGRVNFGDHLARVVVAQLLATHQRTLDDETRTRARMLAIGSILHFAQDGDVVWGSGVNGKMPEETFTARRLDVRAVRGPLTAAFLRRRGIEAPSVFGDPALLLPHLLGGRFRATRSVPYVFVPNFHDLPLVAHEPHVVSPLDGWNRVVARILDARLVLASSLHGLIIAEAFGIPARWVRLSETEHPFKYQDYYLGTGRTRFDHARSIGEALEMGGLPSPSFDVEPLLAAFPWDLWGSSRHADC